MGRKIFSALIVIGFSLAFRIGAASSQDPFYKGKTIRIIVGFSAGGGYDTHARVVPVISRSICPGIRRLR